MYGPLHFNSGNMRLYHFVSEDRLHDLESEAITPAGGQINYYGIGTFLHAWEDAFSHTVGDSIVDGDLNYYNDAGFMGHGLHGHHPDWTFFSQANQQKAMTMAKSVYLTLANFANYYGVSGKVTAWNTIAPQVMDFVKWKPDTYTEHILGKAVETVTFEGYNAKIKHLDTSFDLGDWDRGYRSIYGDAARRQQAAKGSLGGIIQSIGDGLSSINTLLY
jgi:hypothetical protein